MLSDVFNELPNHGYYLRKLPHLFVYSVNAVISQVYPADLSGVDKWLLCHFCDVVVLQIQVVGSNWDDRDHTDVPVLTVERIWIAWGTKTLSGAVRICRGWAQNDWREVCWLLGLWLFQSSKLVVKNLPVGSWALNGLFWLSSLGGHRPH